jgi:hypothetical protein
MSKFNVTSARPAGRGPLATEAVPSGRTHEAGLATRWPWAETAETAEVQ